MLVPAEDAPAIQKLGRLFRLTEVHLWDDSYAVRANDGQRHWRSEEAAFTGPHKDKMCNKPPKEPDEGQSFAEDLELADLMGSLGLPVSFSTSKEKKNTANKAKKKGRQASCEATTKTDGAVKICVNTEEKNSDVHSVPFVEHTNPCSSARTSLGYNEASRDDTNKLLGKDSPYVEEKKESGSSSKFSAEIPPSNEAENQRELEPCKLPDDTDNPVKPESPIRENQAVDRVLPLFKVILENNSVDSESRQSCSEICHEQRLSTGEVLSEDLMSHDSENKVDHGVCLSSAEPSSVDEHACNTDSNFYYAYGDWRAVWDPFYSQYYFYNIQTHESTWSPPEGLEEFSSYCSTSTSNGLGKLGSQHTSIPVQQNSDDMHLDGDGQEQDHCSGLHNLSNIPDEELNSMLTTIEEAQHTESIQIDSSVIEVLEMDQEVASTNKKKKRVRRSHSWNISSDIIKYWTQRYSLFSLFDSGIKMDEEGWFSVTPEPIAQHHASRVGSGLVIDCFTGVGGNAIQFATKCKHVIAVDIDAQKIDCAQHNASVYGVNDHIDFIISDFIHLAPHLKGETAFMSPPWGGPDYAKVETYDMRDMLKPCDGYSLFKLGTMIASRVVMFLPRNIDLNQLADMSLSVDPPWAVEVEKNFLNGKLKAITAYFEEQDV